MKKNIIFFIFAIIFVILIFPNQTKADDCSDKHPGWSCVDTTTREGGDSGCVKLPCHGQPAKILCCPSAAAATGNEGKESAITKFTGFTAAASIPQLIGLALRIILGLMGSIALLMFVYGGFLWLTSGGSADKIKKAKDILVWATIGLVVIFASYTLVDFIIKKVGG
jgi:hypothetical protein